MTDENRRAAIAAEWERVTDAQQEARILIDASKPVGAVSRAYYAAFHAARALLLSLGLQPRTHQGVRSLTNLHFERAGRLPARLAHILSQVARTREDAGYDATVTFADDDAHDTLARATEFVAAAKELLGQDGWLPPTP